MKKTIYLNAGHNIITDPGVITEYGREIDFNITIRDIVISKLEEKGFKVEVVPDNLGLSDSIAWVNRRTNNINDGLALSLHCNCCGGSGAEAYYYGHNAKSKTLATKLLDGYIQETGLEKSNGGVRSDTASNVGELGWIRKTKPWSLLLEMIYMDNKTDVYFFNFQKEKIANGIIRGVMNIYNLPYNPEPIKEEINNLAEIKKLAQKIISLTIE